LKKTGKLYTQLFLGPLFLAFYNWTRFEKFYTFCITVIKQHDHTVELYILENNNKTGIF